MTKIITKAEALRKQARHEQHTKIVYFFTGVLLPALPSASLATSSLTITSKTLFVCQQSQHRR